MSHSLLASRQRTGNRGRYTPEFVVERQIKASPTRSALEALLMASAEERINIRSYEPDDPQSREFVYGLKNVEEAAGAGERLSARGLHTNVNETIDAGAGGGSRVLIGNIHEFVLDGAPL